MFAMLAFDFPFDCPFDSEQIKNNPKLKGGGQECPPHTNIRWSGCWLLLVGWQEFLGHEGLELCWRRVDGFARFQGSHVS
jgi:hypothetical protein